MLKENIPKLLSLIKPNDKVLDIGGWAQPFNRANVVIDINPYESRGVFGSQGGNKEYFNKKTWIIQDVSSKEKLPFKNKEFDFVICSHVLEDIRDPLMLCSEMIRVGKRGYLELPSKTLELIKGVDNKEYCGYYHHRWLIEIKENNSLIFRFKPSFIHNDWRFHLPFRYLKKMSEKEKVSYLFWDKSFNYCEVIQTSRDKVAEHIGNFVKKMGVYAPIRYAIKDIELKLKLFILKVRKKFNKDVHIHKRMNTDDFIAR
jgi:hypothetical protein